MGTCTYCGLCFRLEEREPPLGRFTAFVVSGNKAVLWEEVLLHPSMLLTGKQQQQQNKPGKWNGSGKKSSGPAFFATRNVQGSSGPMADCLQHSESYNLNQP